MNLLTKVSSGVQFGDVSNAGVRNILTRVSMMLFGKFTEQDMEDTMEYFGWRCPYTGKNIKEMIENGHGGYVTDHIVPQNKELCGLNIKGNLILVDREANAKKRNKSVENFLLDDNNPFWETTSRSVREERLEKIREFQKENNYDPKEIQKKIKPLLDKIYADIREDQEKRIENVVQAVGREPLQPIELSTGKAGVKERTKSKNVPLLVFDPDDKEVFKSQLLKNKKAIFYLTYNTGRKTTVLWNANRFTENSDLIANIESKTFWRNWRKEGLVSVRVSID